MANTTAPRHPIFIVGMPRSGTTLLSALLDAHSQIAIAPETHFYTRGRPEDPATPDTVEEAWTRLQQQPGIHDMALTEAEEQRIWDRIAQDDNPGPPDLLRALCSTYAERSEAEAWGEKTPDHLAHVPTIFEEFPEAVVLCIVRDPRDVCLSLQDLPWNRDSLLESAWKWRRYARLTARYEQEYPNQFRAVKYEDLLSTPERLLRDVLAWLHASFEAQMLSFHEDGMGPADTDREPWKQNVHQPIDPANQQKWRTQMGPAGRWVVQRLTGRTLREWEYPASAASVDLDFVRDLVQVLLQSARTVGNRILQRWQVPSRSSGDYRPEWVRREGPR